MGIDVRRFAPLLQPLPQRDVLDTPRPRRRSLGVVANVSALYVAALILFVVLGPLIWQQDPSRQWLSQISLGPTPAVSARVIRDGGDWRLREQVKRLTVVDANTEYVRLAWPNLPDVARYEIYRNIASEPGIGMPLGQTRAWYFQDVLQLRQQIYRYTIVDAERGLQLFSTELRPEPAISAFEAAVQGLVPAEAHAGLPERVILPAHPFGTDALGRDLLARVMAGGRTSLFVGIVAPLLFISFGCLYGALAGMAGGWWDQTAMRVVDFVVALPFLLFMILLRVAFGIGPGEDGVFPLILAMVVMSWTGSARLIRGQVLSLRQQPYIEAARLAGLGHLQIIWRHILPNVLPVILVCFSFAIPQAIFTEAFLSFIGMGVAPPSTSWGALCNDGLKTLLSHPRQMLIPAVFISLAVLSFNVLGDALRDATDRRLGAGQ